MKRLWLLIMAVLSLFCFGVSVSYAAEVGLPLRCAFAGYTLFFVGFWIHSNWDTTR